MKEKKNDMDKTIENNADRSRFIPSNIMDYLIKNLSNPRFLGSIHLKKEMNPNYSQVKDLIASESELKLTKSLKSTIFNPLTKILIVAAVIFNILWFTLIYLL